ncbi:transcriptional regulator [Mycobacterium tuberculosis]|nr:transcriptional regulator [Mycobacterium tuberculosis]
MDGTWTIGELAERAALALAADGAVQVSGRVRDLPNTRLIRWYTTIGLLDPPLARRGRVALYGPRHLLQLVAVKRRQAEGRSIAEIQLELAAADKETLARIAALPPGADGTVTSADSPPPTGRTRQAANAPQAPPGTGSTDVPAAHSIHETPTSPGRDAADANASYAPLGMGSTDIPAAHSIHEVPTVPGRGTADANAAGTDVSPAGVRSNAATDDPGEAMETADSMAAPAGPERDQAGERSDFWKARPDVSYGPATVAPDYGRPLPPVVHGVRLAPGVTLVLDGPAPSDDDLAAIDAAARPLLDELRRRGLLTAGESPAERPAESLARPPADHFRRSP